jgi:hypothetical protein
VAWLRIRRHDDHRATGGAVKFTRAQSGQNSSEVVRIQINRRRQRLCALGASVYGRTAVPGMFMRLPFDPNGATVSGHHP